MTLIPFALMVLIIAAACFGMLIAEDQLSIELPWLFPHRAAKLRGKAGPAGYSFLRNYKRIHQDRIENAVRQMHLGEAVLIQDQAFSSNGDPLPGKIAVYACNNQAADHFFHGYAIVKAREKMMPDFRRTCTTLSQADGHPLAVDTFFK
jgi:hypothetical protein